MDLILIAGFLGSGKTTVLLALAKALTRSGRRVAIVENEVGKVGVDDQFLKQQGLAIREIFGGCVCCELGGNMLEALADLREAYNPDVVIVEPSGVAGPDAVLRILSGSNDVQNVCVVLLVDPSRFEKLLFVCTPLVEASVKAADIIAINKIDIVSRPQQDSVEQAIRRIKSDARIVRMSATKSQDVDRWIMPFLEEQRDVAAHETQAQTDRHDQGSGHDKMAPIVFSQRLTLTVTPGKDHNGDDSLASQLPKSIGNFAKELQAAGCTLIGHIKALVQPANGQADYLLVQTTDLRGQVNTSGKLKSKAPKLNLTLNAIAYDIDQPTMDRLAGVMLDKLQRQFSPGELAGDMTGGGVQ